MSGDPLAEAFLEISPDMADYESKMGKLRSHFSRSIQGLQDTANRMRSSLANSFSVQSAVSRLHQSLIPIVGTIGLISAAKFGYGVARDAKQAEVAFEVMMHSAEKAKEMLAEIKAYADTTPYNLQGVRESAKLLMQLGIEHRNVMPMMKAIGDIAAGDANKMHSLALAMGQVKQNGRLMGGEVMQFANAGFNPLQVIAKRMGKTLPEIKRMMKEGKLSIGDVQQAFVDATSEGGDFFEMAKKQSQTTAGLLSTLQDTVSGSAGKITEIFIRAFKVDSMIVGLTSMTGAVEAFVIRNEAKFTAFGESVRSTVVAIYESVSEKFTAVSSVVMGVLGPAIEVVGGFLSGSRDRLIDFATSMIAASGAMTVMSTVINTARTAMLALSAAFSMTPVGWIVTGIGAAAFAVMYFRKEIMQLIESTGLLPLFAEHFNAIKAIVINMWETVKIIAGNIWTIFSSVLKNISDTFKQVFGGSVIEVLMGVVAASLQFVNRVLDSVSILTTNWQGSWDLMKLYAAQALESIRNIALNVVKGIIDGMSGMIIRSRAVFDTLKAYATNMTKEGYMEEAAKIDKRMKDELKENASTNSGGPLNEATAASDARMAEHQRKIDAQWKKLKEARDRKFGLGDFAPIGGASSMDPTEEEKKKLAKEEPFVPDKGDDPLGKKGKGGKGKGSGGTDTTGIAELHAKIQNSLALDKNGPANKTAKNTKDIVKEVQNTNKMIAVSNARQAAMADLEAKKGEMSEEEFKKKQLELGEKFQKQMEQAAKEDNAAAEANKANAKKPTKGPKFKVGGGMNPTAMMKSQASQEDDKMVAALNTLVGFGRNQEARDRQLIDAVKAGSAATYG